MTQLAPVAWMEMMRIALGKSHIEPEKGDHRFADQAWQQNPGVRATMQAYLYFGGEVDDVVDSLGLDGMAAERIRFALILAREAMAPTNFFWANPAAVKRSYDTGGLSVWRGAVNLTRDTLRNHGMPSMVDRRPFRLGENIAVSPGAVIHRSEVFELIQYTPQREHRLRAAHAGGAAAGEQVLRAGPLARPQHVRIPAAARHPGVHHQLA